MSPSADGSLRVVFAGTPAFAVEIFHGLLNAGFTIPAVMTQPDRPAGRGRMPRASAVKMAALEKHITVLQPETIDQRIIEHVRRLRPQVIVVAAYGLILPSELLSLPALGCINLHASLLPRWRGAAPIQRAILAGDLHTGITVMQMDSGLDTGDILAARSCPIDTHDTAQTLHDRLARLGTELLPSSLLALSEGTLSAIPQDNTQSTYAARLSKSEALLDWHNDATELAKKIRAFNPWPVAYSNIGNKRVKIWEAVALPDTTASQPGVVFAAGASGIDIATGKGTLRVRQLQLPGARPVSAADVVNAGRLLPGTRLHA